jgi:hypothetical protein
MEELRDFAWHNLQVYEDTIVLKHDALRDEEVFHFAETINALPPAFQILLVMPHHSHIMAASKKDLREISRKLGHKEATPLGLFFPKDTVFGHLPIVWGGLHENRCSNTLGHIAPKNTFFHEHGHRIDLILGSKPAAVVYYSENDAQWRKATEDQIKSLGQIKDVTGKQIDEKLYYGSIPLLEHVSRYSESKKSIETFAEMSAHYCDFYRFHKGDRVALDDDLTRVYPILWQEYRDSVLPEIEATALKWLNGLEESKHDIHCAVQPENSGAREGLNHWMRSVELKFGARSLSEIAAERDKLAGFSETMRSLQGTILCPSHQDRWIIEDMQMIYAQCDLLYDAIGTVSKKDLQRHANAMRDFVTKVRGISYSDISENDQGVWRRQMYQHIIDGRLSDETKNLKNWVKLAHDFADAYYHDFSGNKHPWQAAHQHFCRALCAQIDSGEPLNLSAIVPPSPSLSPDSYTQKRVRHGTIQCDDLHPVKAT